MSFPAETFARVNSLTFDDAALEWDLWKTRVVDGKLYAILDTTPSKVVRVDLSTFTKEATITCAAGENQADGAVVDGKYLYLGCYTNPGKIVKIDLSTFSQVSTLNLAGGGRFLYDLVVVDGFLYAASFTNPALITKVNLSTFTEVSTLTLGGGIKFGTSLYAVGGYLYLGTSNSPATVTKISILTFSQITNITLAAGENQAWALIDYKGFLYAGCYDGSGHIVKIDLATFTRVAVIHQIDGYRVAGLAIREGYLYVGDRVNGVCKIDLLTFTEKAYIDLSTPAPNEGYIQDIVIDGDYLYTGSYTRPSVVVKLDITIADLLDSRLRMSGNHHHNNMVSPVQTALIDRWRECRSGFHHTTSGGFTS